MACSGVNAEGYPDPTFYGAWSNIRRKQIQAERRARQEERQRRNPHGTRVYRAESTAPRSEDSSKEGDEADHDDPRGIEA